MRFARPIPRRAPQDRAIVPMINVVFLLLIFFLMTASLSPPEPFPRDPALAEAMRAEAGAEALFVSAEGRLAYGDARDAGALDAVAQRDRDEPLPLRADAAYPATDLARLLGELAARGVTDVSIRAVAP